MSAERYYSKRVKEYFEIFDHLSRKKVDKSYDVERGTNSLISEFNIIGIGLFSLYGGLLLTSIYLENPLIPIYFVVFPFAGAGSLFGSFKLRKKLKTYNSSKP